MAPAVGFEPTTNRLTVDRSTAELRWNNGGANEHFSSRLCNQKLTSGGAYTPHKGIISDRLFTLLSEVSDFLLSDSPYFWFLPLFHG